MPASTDMQPEPVIKKKGYHHGDLRRAIIVEAMRRARSHGERASKTTPRGANPRSTSSACPSVRS